MATFLKWGTGGMSLGNGGDEVLLVDSCETVVDVVVWESASWPGVQNSPPIAAGNGSSIDREPYGFSDRNNMSWDFGLTPDDGNPGNGPDSSSIDTDGDGISNINDNCPETYNPLQSDFDNDGTGDLCDPDIITSDNIGIGFPDPKTKLHISDGLMFLDSQPGGLIMKSSEGDCWILSINNTGQVVTVIADCPD